MDSQERLDALDRLSTASGCDPQPAKSDPTPPSPARELCQITARLVYLLALLDCEDQADPTACCATAYETYCESWDACVEV